MPNELKCPRCGTNIGDENHLIAFLWNDDLPRIPDTDVFGCTCGPVAIERGDEVRWYYPDGGEELALLRDFFALAAWAHPGYREPVDTYYAAHPEALEGER